MSEKVYDQREALWAARKQVVAKEGGSITDRVKAIKLSVFLDALDEWGCTVNDERANAILNFQDGGYDLSAYREEP